jgi:hypothetical protein
MVLSLNKKSEIDLHLEAAAAAIIKNSGHRKDNNKELVVLKISDRVDDTDM